MLALLIEDAVVIPHSYGALKINFKKQCTARVNSDVFALLRVKCTPLPVEYPLNRDLDALLIAGHSEPATWDLAS